MSATEEEKNGAAAGESAEVPAAGAEAKDDGKDPQQEEASVEDRLLEAKSEALKMKEQWIRTAADFDNFRKRTRRELEDARKNGREEILKEFLPVFDNLER